MAELQARMSSREFAEWLAYSRIEPFGAEVDHEMTAANTTLLANINRNPKHKAFEVEDFMPHLRESVKPAAPETLMAKADSIFMRLGGKRPA